MPVGATIGAVGAVASAGIGAYSASKASDQQAAAATNALNFQKGVYDNNQGLVKDQQATNTSNLMPYATNGQNAMYSLASLYGLATPGTANMSANDRVNSGWEAFKSLPAYTFPLEQGNLALTRQLNAQGRTQSGAQARATQQFGQGLASQYMMSNYVNPLMSMAQQGQGAMTSLTSANSNLTGSLVGGNIASGGQIGQSYGNLGTAQASGTIGMGNAVSGGINGAANNLAVYSALANGGGGSAYSGGNTTPIGNTFGGYNSSGSPNMGGTGSFGGIQYPAN